MPASGIYACADRACLFFLKKITQYNTDIYNVHTLIHMNART